MYVLCFKQLILGKLFNKARPILLYVLRHSDSDIGIVMEFPYSPHVVLRDADTLRLHVSRLCKRMTTGVKKPRLGKLL